LSLKRTHVFSASLLNNVRFGFFREPRYFFSGRAKHRERRRRTCRDFCSGGPSARWWWAEARRRIRPRRWVWREATTAATFPSRGILFTFENRLTWTRGRISGVLACAAEVFSRTKTNCAEPIRTGDIHEPADILAGTASSFLFDPAPTEMNWQSVLGAWYAVRT